MKATQTKNPPHPTSPLEGEERKNAPLLTKEARGEVTKGRLRGVYGFTLVELIVVITILAILGAIGFVTMSGYFAGARDSARLSDMNNIYTQLNLTLGMDGSLPFPDDYRTITLSGVTITYQGYAGKDVLNAIKFEKGGRDPKDDVYYTYTINKKKSQAQLLGYFEEYDTAKLSNIAKLIPETYAAAPDDYLERRIGTLGKNIGILLDSTTLVPVQQNSSGTLTLTDTSTGYAMYFNSTTTATGAGTDIKTAFLVNSVASGSLGGGTVVVVPPVVINTCGSSNGTTVASNGFSGSLCAGTGTVLSWSGIGGTTTDSTLSWTCQNGTQTGSCSASYNKPTTGTRGQSCDTYDKLIGSLTGSYQVWSMCNVGAYQAWVNQGTLTNGSGSVTDNTLALRYTIGSYYQWGRNDNVTPQGTPTTTKASAGTLANGVGHTNFITNGADPYDWIATQNDNLWGGSGTTSTAGTYTSQGSPAAMQGPCPSGYHIPTQYEWWKSLSVINSALTNSSSWQNDTSVATTLKLPLSGGRYYSPAGYGSQGLYGLYWSSSPNGIYGYHVYISGTQVNPLNSTSRAYGLTVRCLKN